MRHSFVIERGIDGDMKVELKMSYGRRFNVKDFTEVDGTRLLEGFNEVIRKFENLGIFNCQPESVLFFF